MGEALNEFYVKGVSHNINFLSSVFCHQRFIRGRISTNFIAEEYPEGHNPFDVINKDKNNILYINLRTLR